MVNTTFSFSHSSTDGRLGCIHLLVKVNTAVVYMDVQVSLWAAVFNSLDMHPKVRFLGIIPSFIFQRTFILFSYSILHSDQQCSRVPLPWHPLQHLIFSLLLKSQLNGYEIALQFDFKLHFLIIIWCWASFHRLIKTISSLEK